MKKDTQTRWVMATADALRECGADNIEVGFVNDRVPVKDAGWWASLTYRGSKMFVEKLPSPTDAVVYLFVTIIAGIPCPLCNRPITIGHNEVGLIREAIVEDGILKANPIDRHPNHYCFRTMLLNEIRWSWCSEIDPGDFRP